MKFIPSALLATGLVASSVFASALPAVGHDDLVESTPSAGETLTTLPSSFSVTMSDDLLDLDDKGSGFGIEIRDAEGLYYGDGCVIVDGPTMSTQAELGAPGEYTVVWQVVSSDGHPTSDEFSFTWAPSGEYTSSTGSETPGDCNGLYARSAEPHDDEESHGDEEKAGYVGGFIAGGVALLLIAIATAVVVVRRKK